MRVHPQRRGDRPDGRIATRVARGGGAIRELVTALAELRRAAPDSVETPPVVLPPIAHTGTRRRLSGCPRSRAVKSTCSSWRVASPSSVFWSPSCPACKQLLPRLLEWERAQSAESGAARCDRDGQPRCQLPARLPLARPARRRRPGQPRVSAASGPRAPSWWTPTSRVASGLGRRRGRGPRAVATSGRARAGGPACGARRSRPLAPADRLTPEAMTRRGRPEPTRSPTTNVSCCAQHSCAMRGSRAIGRPGPRGSRRVASRSARRRLLPLVCRNLERAGIALPTRLKTAYATALGANTRLLQLAEDVLGRLAHAGIPTLVLKGTALLLLHYRDHGVRPMSDLDVLVPPARAREAFAALDGLGLAGRRSGRAACAPGCTPGCSAAVPERHSTSTGMRPTRRASQAPTTPSGPARRPSTSCGQATKALNARTSSSTASSTACAGASRRPASGWRTRPRSCAVAASTRSAWLPRPRGCSWSDAMRDGLEQVLRGARTRARASRRAVALAERAHGVRRARWSSASGARAGRPARCAAEPVVRLSTRRARRRASGASSPKTWGLERRRALPAVLARKALAPRPGPLAARRRRGLRA